MQEQTEVPFYTGRHLLILKEGSSNILKTTKMLESKWGLRVANTADFVKETISESKIQNADVLFYNELGIALLAGDEEMMKLLQKSDADYYIEPEKVVYIP